MSALAMAAAAALLAVALRGVAIRRAARDRRRLGDPSLLARLGPLPGPGRRWLRAALLAIGSGGVAAAVATSGSAEVERAPTGRETVLVLDASNSMLARDVEPRRLDRQRELARRLASRLPGEVGVVYFAGRGYVLTPLTTDRNAVVSFVEAVQPASVGRGGSDLAAGLEQALDLLAGGREGVAKAVVLFSDGEETAGRPLTAAVARAEAAGIPIHAVGIGTARGAPIPLTRDAAIDVAAAVRRPEGAEAGSRRGTEYLHGPDGEVVITRLEPEVLRDAASATGAVYVEGTAAGVDAVMARLSDGQPPEPETPAGGGLPLLLVGAFLLLWVEGFALRRG